MTVAGVFLVRHEALASQFFSWVAMIVMTVKLGASAAITTGGHREQLLRLVLPVVGSANVW